MIKIKLTFLVNRTFPDTDTNPVISDYLVCEGSWGNIQFMSVVPECVLSYKGTVCVFLVTRALCVFLVTL